MSFPKDFMWGAASAAYQIEGGFDADGKGPSIWDEYCRRPGITFQGQTAEVACDHYHRWPEDVDLMKGLGLRAYRLSFSWPRIFPAGDGPVNSRGLDFYDRLIDGLLAAGIEPFVTLFHWDLPLSLHGRGGWLNRDTARAFADYAEFVGHHFSDRVHHWITLNEPSIHMVCGHWEGGMAPGFKLGFPDLLRASHHHLLAHGLAMTALRASARSPIQVGHTHACAPSVPASDSVADREAARANTFNMPADPHAGDMHASSWWSDPIYLGVYPEETLRVWSRYWTPPEADLKLIAQNPDFIGLNIYHSRKVKAGPNGPVIVPWETGRPQTLMSWPVTPEGLYWGAVFFHERYRRPVYVFESGASVTDIPDERGRVHDGARIDYHAHYLRAFRKAGEAGVLIGGYFVWSVMDVFEWNGGYKDKFGLIHIDHQTLKRTPKDSYDWYRQVIAKNGANL